MGVGSSGGEEKTFIIYSAIGLWCNLVATHRPATLSATSQDEEDVPVGNATPEIEASEQELPDQPEPDNTELAENPNNPEADVMARMQLMLCLSHKESTLAGFVNHHKGTCNSRD